MIAGRIYATVFRNQLLNLLGCVTREYVLKKINQMAADIAAKKFMTDIGAICAGKDGLNGSADIVSRIDQSAIDVEQINGKCGNSQAIDRLAIEDVHTTASRIFRSSPS